MDHRNRKAREPGYARSEHTGAALIVSESPIAVFDRLLADHARTVRIIERDQVNVEGARVRATLRTVRGTGCCRAGSRRSSVGCRTA